MGDRGQQFLGDPRPELGDAPLMPGGAEVSPLARERQQILVPAGVAADPGEPLGEVAAGEAFLDGPADHWTIDPVLLLIPRGVARLEFGAMCLRALVEGRRLGVPRMEG